MAHVYFLESWLQKIFMVGSVVHQWKFENVGESGSCHRVSSDRENRALAGKLNDPGK